ncbi:bifunctional 4'-phosphopantothenoylcysteine decarboxylase/phosphopantothenoylcysteine synthetase, partial [Pseudoalteromonas sp. S3178]|uniref:phosphopantothenoylcysteine decarboxylase domain-containing protein n=1 Tax=Pseudoalteromonas sp. S3178 TaxID=579532 RepID=UPI001284127F
ALELGATVNLISGPVSLSAPEGATLFPIETARDMLNSALQLAPQSDVFIGCASVADYRAATIAEHQIKKQGDEITLTMVKNPDVIAHVAAIKENRPYTVGFAAETQDIQQYAKAKLKN